MSSNEYDIYIKETINFARSFVIKSNMTMAAINRSVAAYGFTVGDDPREWRYCKNLMGEYFRVLDAFGNWKLGSDVKMYVRSHENKPDFINEHGIPSPVEIGDQVFLTKGAMDQLKFTRSVYQRRDRFYRELLDTYPDQEMLVNRILWPINMGIDEVVSVPAGTILYYDPDGLAVNEVNLIPLLQDRMYRHFNHYSNARYSLTDQYYPAAYEALTLNHLVLTLISIRWQNVHTPYASKFHVWQYLGNFYDIYRHRDTLPHDVALWLYRNIDDLVAYAGSNATLRKLEREFANPGGLKLRQVELAKDSSAIESIFDHKPEVIYTHPLYPDKGDIVKTGRGEIADLLDLVRRQALSNDDNFEDDVIRLRRRALLNPQSRNVTGVVEVSTAVSAVGDLIDKVVEYKNLWFYLSAYRRMDTNEEISVFRYSVLLSVPGNNSVTITAGEAAAILIYAASRYIGITLVDTPTVLVRDVVARFLTDEDRRVEFNRMIQGDVKAGIAPIIENMVRDMEPLEPSYTNAMVTQGEFKDYAGKVMSAKVRQKLSLIWEGDAVIRAELKNARNQLYEDVLVKLVPQDTYAELFADLQLNMEFLDLIDAKYLAEDIVRKILGNVEVHEGLPSPYYEVMEILRALSSFTTLFSPSASSLDAVTLEKPDFLPTSATMECSASELIEAGPIGIYSYDASMEITAVDVDGGVDPTTNTVEIVTTDHWIDSGIGDIGQLSFSGDEVAIIDISSPSMNFTDISFEYTLL